MGGCGCGANAGVRTTSRDEELLVTEDGAFRRTGKAPGSSSEDVYIGLRRRRVIDAPFTDDSRSRSRSRSRFRDGGRGGEAPCFEFRAGSGESSRMASPRDGGEGSRLIVSRGKESVRFTETRGSGEFSRCREPWGVGDGSRLTRLGGDTLRSGSRSRCRESRS